MATTNDFSRTFLPNTAMSAWRRVSVSSNGTIQLAAIGEPGVGVLQEDVLGLGYENPKVRLYGTGTTLVTASGAATIGNTAYTAANGQVQAATSAGAVTFGVFLSTVPTGTVAEVLPLPQF